MESSFPGLLPSQVVRAGSACTQSPCFPQEPAFPLLPVSLWALMIFRLFTPLGLVIVTAPVVMVSTYVYLRTSPEEGVAHSRRPITSSKGVKETWCFFYPEW